MAVTENSPEITLQVPTDDGNPSPFSPSPSPSPSSAETNFRELDDAFLQNQARIWLGEILQIRFDEQMNISDLLADGELLFEVSEVISRTLPTLDEDANHPKGNEWKSAASSKSTMRYMPYYNVGSFLRMCKNLGMNGIDLFTPSDVVEKRNTRKVCMCLRSLSKKMRSRSINQKVPDFDSVTCTLSMSTDMVKCIRKSLELSQYSRSPSIGHDSEKVPRVRSSQRMSISTSAVSNGYSSDNCDDAESSNIIAESYGSSDYACDAASPSNPGSQVITDSEALEVQVNIEDLESEENEQCEYLSPSIGESVGSPFSQYYSDEELSILPSSPGLGSRISGNVVEEEAEDGCQKGDVIVNHVPIDWGDSSLDVEDYRDDDTNIDVTDQNVTHYEKDIDTTCCSGCSPTRENNTCDKVAENSAHPSETEREKSSSDNISDEGRGLSVPHVYVEEDLCAGEAPIHKLESSDDEQVDIDAGEHEMVIRRLSLDSVKSSSDDKFKVKDNDLSSELLLQSTYQVSSPVEASDCSSSDDEKQESQTFTEVMNVGENSCFSTLNNADATSNNLAGQVELHVEQFPCSADSQTRSLNSPGPNPEFDAQNGKEAFDANMATSDHTELCPENHLVGGNASILTGVDINSSPDIVVAKDNMECSDDNNDLFESVNSKPINIEDVTPSSDPEFMGGNESNSLDMLDGSEMSSPCIIVAKDNIKCSEDNQDTLKGSGDYNVLAESINCKPLNIEDAPSVNNSATTLSDPQAGGGSPESGEDTDHKHHECAENKETVESEHKGTDKETPKSQPKRKMLKSVVQGTALVGVAVFLLHLRRNSRSNLLEAKKPPIEGQRKNTPKPSVQKSQKGGSSSSVYPAEKLKLGI